MTKRRIYMDHAATTYVKPAVLEAMLPFFTETFGNPSSIHTRGQIARSAVDRAREQVAKAINAQPAEIFFTGGGSEADNMALKGVVENYAKKGNHIITTKIEHHAILHTCEWLEKNRGISVTYLDVDEFGRVTPEQVEAAIRPETILVTIMFANNEIGTIEPIAEIGAVCKKHGVLFHTDAVQAVGAVPIDVKAMNIDLLSMSAHKFYGPKGIGALYVKKGVRIPSFIHGGAQERGRRAGTENLPGIIGMGKAIEMATETLEESNKRIAAMRDRLMKGLLERVPDSRVNGDLEHRLPNNLNMCFKYIEGEALLLRLDLAGIEGSSGSACTSGSLDPSHVLLAIGLPHEIAHGSLRLTLGDGTTDEDIDYVLDTLPGIVRTLREMSPIFEK
ncbi:MAG: cysteine desulfurase NifS [Christensenellales bacterium]|jgi:cysteine desulfurase